MPAMEGLLKLFDMWEIQVLVLLSFALQVFLFFTGSRRQHSTSMVLRLSIWAAYLGADFVAVYTLGLVSRHEEISAERHVTGVTQSLVFFWAPFLLIHLGGQDTITAFSMEDNSLWLRHLLNLVVQVVLAIYVFWKSIGRHSLELLLSCVFLFVVGIIKYGERIWSLHCGSFTSLENSSGRRYKGLPTLDEKEDMDEESNSQVSTSGGYDSTVYIAMCSMPHVHDIFSGHNFISESAPPDRMLDDSTNVIKTVSIILSLMYADLYTKALVVRTRSGIIFRCISQMSAVVAFALFHANDKQRYSKKDIAITYSLLVGVFFLELCAMFISMKSPWTWAWLKVRKWDKLAMLSWLLFSSDIRRPKAKQCSLPSMGQYNFLSWVTGSGHARTFKQRVMTMCKWLVNLVCLERKKIFWMSKLLDTEYVNVDEVLMECVAKEISHLSEDEGSNKSISKKLLDFLAYSPDFGATILMMHGLTDEHLRKYATSGAADMEANTEIVDMIAVCRKLSNYMMYLLATHPSILPLSLSAKSILDCLQDPKDFNFELNTLDGALEPTMEVVELVSVWARLLIYAAGKSRQEMHTAQLSRGGELITYVWLLMALHGLGDSQTRRIRLTNGDTSEGKVEETYAFPVPTATSIGPEEASSSITAGVINRWQHLARRLRSMPPGRADSSPRVVGDQIND
ncbi:uncharacterized protein LOC119335346 [Triticum dicoccoides]|uniref:uncharacterized protein LOC119335346 n=1 Tax=Triticum dicoccoides TaxID=85692 RepID=UPI000E7B1B5D|nr:uncharacterized protein LOC119335346 [Triticum dicoccoides]